MEITIRPDGVWYHGSPARFEELRANSTVTQWRELAEAFSHKPARLGYDDDGVIFHDGNEVGYLYVVDEAVRIGEDIYRHPRTTMDYNAEFLTKRPLKVKRIAQIPVDAAAAEKLLEFMKKKDDFT